MSKYVKKNNNNRIVQYHLLLINYANDNSRIYVSFSLAMSEIMDLQKNKMRETAKELWYQKWKLDKFQSAEDHLCLPISAYISKI